MPCCDCNAMHIHDESTWRRRRHIHRLHANACCNETSHFLPHFLCLFRYPGSLSLFAPVSFFSDCHASCCCVHAIADNIFYANLFPFLLVSLHWLLVRTDAHVFASLWFLFVLLLIPLLGYYWCTWSLISGQIVGRRSDKREREKERHASARAVLCQAWACGCSCLSGLRLDAAQLIRLCDCLSCTNDSFAPLLAIQCHTLVTSDLCKCLSFVSAGILVPSERERESRNCFSPDKDSLKMTPDPVRSKYSSVKQFAGNVIALLSSLLSHWRFPAACFLLHSRHLILSTGLFAPLFLWLLSVSSIHESSSFFLPFLPVVSGAWNLQSEPPKKTRKGKERTWSLPESKGKQAITWRERERERGWQEDMCSWVGAGMKWGRRDRVENRKNLHGKDCMKRGKRKNERGRECSKFSSWRLILIYIENTFLHSFRPPVSSRIFCCFFW